MNNKFYAEISDILKQELKLAKKCIIEETEEVAKETVDNLKATSPRGSRKRKKYANSWTYKDNGDGTFTIHLKKPNYRLAHLLEKGHQIIKNGRSVGRARAIVHIEPAEQQAIKSLEKKVIARLEDG